MMIESRCRTILKYSSAASSLLEEQYLVILSWFGIFIQFFFLLSPGGCRASAYSLNTA